MNVTLFPGMSHAQAQQVCKRLGVRLVQDLRGGVRVEPDPRQQKPSDENVVTLKPEPPRAA